VDRDDIVIGIDGGGSKTECWLAARSSAASPTVLGRGVSGPSNSQVVGFDRALASLDEAIDAAFTAAGLTCQVASAAVVGLAGSDRDENRRAIEEWAQRRALAVRFRVVHDALPVLVAGASQGWGVALISGTGSLAFGQGPDGRSCRSGGWGFLLGDEGSGYSIARAGLRAAARGAEGRGPATRLTDAFVRHFGVRAPLEMIAAVSPMADDRAAIAGLAEVVFGVAEGGDAMGRAILDHAAMELGAMVIAVARMLGFVAGFPLVLSGGILLRHGVLRDLVTNVLGGHGLRPESVVCVAEPVLGAVRLAQTL